MQAKTAQKIHPAPEPVAESDSQPGAPPVPEVLSGTSHWVSMVINIVMVLVAMGAVAMTYGLQRRVETAQQEVTKQIGRAHV
jgi:hypothetical protein